MNGDELAATLALMGFTMLQSGAMLGADKARRIIVRLPYVKGQAMLQWRQSSRGNAYRWYFSTFDPQLWREADWDIGLISYISPRMARQFINAYTR